MHPDDVAFDQVQDAYREVETDKFLHLPWASVDQLVGGIGPGQVWFVGAYSGHGKTTFLLSAVDEWHRMGRAVFFMGLESKPEILRTQWACMRLGLDAGDVLSGALIGRADWEFTRRRLKDEVGNLMQAVHFSPEKFVDAQVLANACKQAHEMGSDVLIIDHVDHLEGDGDLYQASVRSMKTLLKLAQQYKLRVLAATQFNNEMVKASKVGLHQPPSPTAVYMGNHKRQIASGMLGLYKPFRFDVTVEELKGYRDGRLEASQVVEPQTMAVCVMKHRLYGNREGKRAFLRVEKGRVIEDENTNSIGHHGIRTGGAA